MAEEKSSLREQLILGAVQTFIFAVFLAVFGLWMSRNLERYKSALADETEKLKTALQITTPLMQKRLSGYLEIQQAARNVNEVLEIYYYRAKEPPSVDVMTNKLMALEDAMKIGPGSRGGSVVLKTDVPYALNELIKAKEKYAATSSDRMNAAVDLFLNTVMDDLRKGELKENQTEAFDTAARAHLKDAFRRLNSEINQALGMDEAPIK